MILVKQAGKGGFDPGWSTLRPFLSDRLKSVLTPADKPAHPAARVMKKDNQEALPNLPPRFVGERAGLSVMEWFWKSVEAGNNHFSTPISLRTALTSLHIRRNFFRQAGW
jgi:hypothetical protein